MGNQHILHGGVAKDYFVSLNMIHVSLDMNGLHGSIQRDISKPVNDPELTGQFDIVTNFGTSEHVLDQYQGFKNMHDFTKIGGLQVHAVPLLGSWKNHCSYHYGENFFDRLTQLSDYKMNEKEIVRWNKRGGRELLCSIITKSSEMFVSELDFYTCGITKNHHPIPLAFPAWHPPQM